MPENPFLQTLTHPLFPSRPEVLDAFAKHPPLMAVWLDGGAYQQKLAWVREETPWALGAFLANPRYLVRGSGGC